MLTNKPLSFQQLTRLEQVHSAMAELIIEADALDGELAQEGNEHHVGVGIVASHLGAAASYLTTWRKDWGLYPAAAPQAHQEGANA